MTTHSQVHRRALLSGALGAGAFVSAVALSGCGGDSPAGTSGSPSATHQAAPAPDVIRSEVARAERELLAAYDSVIAQFPELRPMLEPIRTQHADHLAAMGVDGPDASPEALAATAELAVAALRSAERQAAAARRASCIACTAPDLTRTLALIAASEQSHVPALAQVAQ